MGIEILAGRPCENLRLLRPGIVFLCVSGGRALILIFCFILYGSRVSLCGPSRGEISLKPVNSSCSSVPVTCLVIMGLDFCLPLQTVISQREGNMSYLEIPSTQHMSGSSLILDEFRVFLQLPTFLFPKVGWCFIGQGRRKEKTFRF